MSRRLAVSIGIAVLLLAGAAVFVGVDRIGDEPATASTAGRAPTTVEVVRTDLVERETLGGTLRYRSPRTLFASGSGTVTDLPAGGTVIERGEAAYELNGQPVVTMFGDRPMWRPLDETATNGADIAQLETNLEALGFTADGDLVVDETFDEATTAAVEAWQESLDREETGVVGLGDIAFVTGPIRVGVAATAVGSVVIPGAPMYAVTARNHEVVVLLDADRQDLLAVSDVVSITLPDDTVTEGTVAEVSPLVITTDTEDGEGRRVVEVSIDLMDQGVVTALDEAPVEVDVAADTAQAVVAVPVEALLALAEGGYAVEIAEGAATRLVAVDIGTFADGLVEIVGDVQPGARVVVPGTP